MNMKTVGFIGLGTMGKPMAANLIQKGFRVNVYNRTSDKAQELVALGAVQAASPAEAANEADVIVTMLSNDQVVLDSLFGENGLAHSLRPGQTVIDCSTVSPATSRKIYDELASHLVDFLDAPVTGSKPAAESGSLVFMVGGQEETLDAQRDVFAAMGSKIVYMGPSGSGSYAKLAHNTMVGINALGLMEGLSMVTKAGLDPESFLSIVLSGAANSRQAELKGSKIVSRDFSNQFSTKLMLKDLLLAGDVADGFQLPSPMLRTATGLFQMGLAKGLGEDDLCAVIQCYEDWMHMQVNGRQKPPEVTTERRRNARIQLDIKLHLSVYQWEQEGSFSGQLIEGSLVDLSEGGIRIVSSFPLARDMFIVLHFPKEADLPPITARIIRIDPDNGLFRYGCMLSGLPPYVRLKLEEYIRVQSEEQEKASQA
ncbi:NAD(P)-binding domain-containing protein [Paenibacillus ehimensis]|uniref:NAD(P)-binding domain-containing protein n=1 Tax=Paenibacillus ehimensis TaxID=79264 RepID=UPI002DBE5322|nr:NAD(P)-binding domain-containing protein [Paenibacillus ehimensis]MEC0207593.1 NAD(P)-binding domain-containing protein [Paenibacillus ehimensis]